MINWREYPFSKLLIPFAFGIGLAMYFEKGNTSLLILLMLLVLIVSGILHRIRGNIRANYGFGLLMLIGFFLFGYTLTLLRNELNHPYHFQVYLNQKLQPVLGTIADMPVTKGDKIKFILKAEEIAYLSQDSSETITQSCIGNLLVYLPKDSLSKNLKYGDQIALAGYLNAVAPPTNPHAFDYRQYLHYKNINFQTFVKASDWKFTEASKANPILKAAFYLRGNFIEILRKYLKDDDQFSVGSALILGYKDEITDEVRTAYAGTGAMHVLAVSGLHVGLIFLILNALLKVFHNNQIWWKVLRVILLLSGIWAFSILTGASPSVLRAATMFSFMTVGLSLKQHTNIYNSLAASAFFLLAYDPFLLMNIGFQMSYLAVIGIVYFQPKIAGWWLIENKIGNYLWQLVAVSIAAQLMTLPMSLFYFHQFPSFFWLSGLVVVPAAGFILGGGLLLFMVESILPGWGAPIGFLLDRLIFVVNWCIFQIHQIPHAVVKGIWIGGMVAFLLYLLIFCIIGVINTRRWKWVMYGAAFFAAISLNLAFKSFRQEQQQKIIVYDVYKYSLIDLVNGRDCITLQSADIPEESVQFATENNRWAMGVESVQTFSLSEDSLQTLPNLLFKRGRFQFVNQDFGIIDGPLNPDFEGSKINLDYVLIRNSPDIDIEELSNYLTFKKIIFDGSNKKYKVKNWQQICDSMHIETWYTAENGAFVLEIPEKR